MKKHYYLLIGLLLLCGFDQAKTYTMHAYYIYVFTQNITWPDGENEEDFKIGIVGESAIVGPLQKMASLKKVNNKLIKVITFSSVEEIQDCNILFLPAEQSANFSKALNTIGDRSILLVTEKGGLGAKGSSINFVLKNSRLMFEINNEALNKANLVVASQLKRFAVQL